DVVAAPLELRAFDGPRHPLLVAAAFVDDRPDRPGGCVDETAHPNAWHAATFDRLRPGEDLASLDASSLVGAELGARGDGSDEKEREQDRSGAHEDQNAQRTLP